MTAYTKSTNFATKDTLTSGDPLKIVKGTEINTEFDNIATAVNSKSDTASPTFTGTVTIPILSYAGTTLSAAVTGTGKMVLDTSPTLVTPILGTPTSGVLTNCTGVQYTGFKNRIINGAMVIDQRNAGASITPTNLGYTLDRWTTILSQASKITLQQNQGSVTPPSGFSNYLGITVGASANVTVGAADYFAVRQYVEGFNFADFDFGKATAKTVTVSFWVRSSVTGTFYGSLLNNAVNRGYPFSYSINSANTWEQKTATIAGDTTGTWEGATNATGVQVCFSLGFGSNFYGTANAWNGSSAYSASGETRVITTNSATFYITGVQLEKGSTATSIDYRPYGTELALCQRYLPCFNFSASNGSLGSGFANATTSALINCVFPVQVRTPATGILVTGSFNAYTAAGGNSGNFTSIALAAGQSAYSGALNCTGGTGLTAAQGTFLLSPAGNSQIQFTGCEL